MVLMLSYRDVLVNQWCYCCQADMYHCSARCCEDVDLTVDEVQRCVERCSSKLNHSHEFIQGEVEKFQVSRTSDW